MISGATSGSGGAALGVHLADARSEGNRHNVKTELGDTRYINSTDIQEAVEELRVLTRFANTATPLVHFHCDPSPLEDFTEELKIRYWTAVEKEFGLQDQAFVESVHTSWRKIENLFDVDDVRQLHGEENVRFNELENRYEVLMNHYHRVYDRMKLDGSPISLSHDYARREKVNRVFEFEHGFELTQGAHNRAVEKQLRRESRNDVADAIVANGFTQGPRPVAKLNSTEKEQQKRTGIKKGDVQKDLFKAWTNCDCGKAFEAAINNMGYKLAHGDKAIVVIDATGNVHSVGRLIAAESKRLSKDKVKSATVDKRLTTLDIKGLEEVRKGSIATIKNKEIVNVRPNNTNPARLKPPVSLRDMPRLLKCNRLSNQCLQPKNLLQRDAHDSQRGRLRRDGDSVHLVQPERAAPAGKLVTNQTISAAPPPRPPTQVRPEAKVTATPQAQAHVRPTALPATAPPKAETKAAPAAAVAAPLVKAAPEAAQAAPLVKAARTAATSGGPVSVGGRSVRPINPNDPADVARFLQEFAEAARSRLQHYIDNPPEGIDPAIIKSLIAKLFIIKFIDEHELTRPKERRAQPRAVPENVRAATELVDALKLKVIEVSKPRPWYDFCACSRVAAVNDKLEQAINDRQEAIRFSAASMRSDIERENMWQQYDNNRWREFNLHEAALREVDDAIDLNDKEIVDLMPNVVRAIDCLKKRKSGAASGVCNNEYSDIWTYGKP